MATPDCPSCDRALLPVGDGVWHCSVCSTDFNLDDLRPMEPARLNYNVIARQLLEAQHNGSRAPFHIKPPMPGWAIAWFYYYMDIQETDTQGRGVMSHLRALDAILTRFCQRFPGRVLRLVDYIECQHVHGRVGYAIAIPVLDELGGSSVTAVARAAIDYQYSEPRFGLFPEFIEEDELMSWVPPSDGASQSVKASESSSVALQSGS